MNEVPVAPPRSRRASRAETAPGATVTDLEQELRRRVDGEVRFDAGSRGAYSTDASNYRAVPIGVVVPRSVEAGAEAVLVARDVGVPVLSRGGGTSLAGQTANAALVIDWSKYCHGLLSVDPERRTCVVEPGIVLDTLNDRLRRHGLVYGPKPATHSHCTLGGMIGNNSCGATAQRTGKVADNVARLEILLIDGTRLWVGPTTDEELRAIVAGNGREADLYRRLDDLRDRFGDEIRERYPRIPRRVSGYNLDQLLPEHGFDLARALVGSEGTLATVLRAELTLVPTVPATVMVAIAYPTIADAADAVPDLLPHRPIALEGLDDKLIGFERSKRLNPEAVRLLPDGGGWLMVQMGGETADDARSAAEDMLAALGRRADEGSVRLYDDPEHEAQLWAVREAGLGATARLPGAGDAWPGWEDSAVGPEQLGDYLRDLQGLLDRFDLGRASLYGHFGQGCVHTRIPFVLTTAHGVGQFRRFMEEAADLVVSYGGSLTGEHGDGQARGELLTRMFGPSLVGAFGQMKAIFDPRNQMNPGKLVHPRPLDHDLRLGTDYDHSVSGTWFRYPDDSGDFSRAVLRCVGVGKCRREGGDGVMCPSYQVTREEEHSTRGRARLLFEMLDGGARDGTVTDGWRSTAVRDALDLCLACKGCRSDCPVEVDMATYKAEFLAHHYAHRLRPRSHYSLGWLPVMAGLIDATRLAPAVNLITGWRPTARLAARAGGIEPRRRIPSFARRSLQRAAADTPSPRDGGWRGDVVLWPDTFTNHFDPQIGVAAREVIERAGWSVTVPHQRVCCGLTWISTGQLGTAQRVLRRTLDVLRPHLRRGALVVGLEPSCTAVFRSDARELLAPGSDLDRLADQTVTLAELLVDHSPGWEPPAISQPVAVQTHCHHHAIMTTAADRRLLAAAGADPEFLQSGCCGLAGNFGFEPGHYEVSMACAERVLLPALRERDADDVVLADGFSCRTQIAEGTGGGRRGRHLAELLCDALRQSDQRSAPGPASQPAG